MRKKATKNNPIKQQDNVSQQEEDQELSQNKRGRQDNSLSVLTKKFVDLIRNSQNSTIDLNDAVKKLNVQKRRIYDITNVLQGIGYVQKMAKNTIKWIGGGQDPQIQKQIAQMKNKCSVMSLQEQKVQDQIREINKKIKNQYLDNEALRQYLYITYDDCMKINQGMNQDGNNSSLLLLSAPKGSTLQVTQQQKGKYELILDATGKGGIKAFVIQNGKDIKQYQSNNQVQKEENIKKQSS